MKYDKHTCNELCGCGTQDDAQRIALDLVSRAIHAYPNQKGNVNCAVMLQAVSNHFEALVKDLFLGRSALLLKDEPELALACQLTGAKPRDLAMDVALDEWDETVKQFHRRFLAYYYDNPEAAKRRGSFVCEELGNQEYAGLFHSTPPKETLRNHGVTFEGDAGQGTSSNEAMALILEAFKRGGGRKPN
jgi:hypothetical protein